jgi:hypothetical protein
MSGRDKGTFVAGLAVGLVVGLAGGLWAGLSARPAAVAEGGATRDEGGGLRGRVTVRGVPVPYVTLMATAANGANENGEYLMPAPPLGELKFQVFVPAKLPKGMTLPERYGKPNSGLTFPYTGGQQTFDIDLQP